MYYFVYPITKQGKNTGFFSFFCLISLPHSNLGIPLAGYGLSIHLSIGLSIHLSIGLSIHLSIGLSIHLSIGLSIHLSICVDILIMFS